MAKRHNSINKNKNREGDGVVSSGLKRLVLFALVLITFIVFSDAIPNEFTNWDDRTYITENPLIRNLSYDGIKDIFTSPYSGHYHPLTCLSNAIEYHFFKLNPKAYHFFNVLLHVLNVILVFYFIMMLIGKIWIAAISSLFFAIHPMHVESVAWVSERKDVLYAFFFLAALIYYIKYIQSLNNKDGVLNSFFKRPATIYIITLCLFQLSLLSKSMAVTLPAIMLLIDYYYKRKITKKIIIEKVPFFILSILFIVIALPIQKEAVQDVVFFKFPDRIFVVTHSLLFYLQKLFLPTQLSCIHPFPVKENGFLPFEYYLSAGLIAVIIFGIYKSGKYRSLLIFGALFFLTTLFPASGIFSFGTVEVAERYTYIPYLGLFFIIGQFTESKILPPGLKRKIIIGVLAIYAVLFSYASYQRNKVWQNSITLWSDAIEKIPHVGNDKAGNLSPYYAYAYYNRGSAKSFLKDFQGSIEDNNLSILINPSYPKAFYNRAFAKNNLHDYEGSLVDYSEAIRLDSGYANAYLNRAAMRNAIFKDYEGAINDFTKAIRFKTNFTAAAYYNRGLAYFELQDISKTCLDWKKSADAGNVDALHALENYCK